MSAQESAYAPGLAGVPAARSAVCFLDGTVGKLQYRGYPIQELALTCSYEEVVYLLLFGELPNREALASLTSELAAARAVPREVLSLLASLPRDGHPMAALSTALIAMGMALPGDHVRDLVYRRTTAVRMVACFPTLVAAFERSRRGEAPIAPRSDLGHAASFLHMLSGEAPDAIVEKTLDVALVLHAEHQMNASTFAARVVGSTLASPCATMSAAVSALSGPAPRRRERARARDARIDPLGLGEGRPRVGRGAAREQGQDHGVRAPRVQGQGPARDDPPGARRRPLRGEGQDALYDVAVELEAQMAELVGDKGVYPNVDFYSGIVYDKMGIAVDLFTPIFAIARIAGWTAHLLEQLEDNRIFRPNQIWIGEADREVVPIDRR